MKKAFFGLIVIVITAYLNSGVLALPEDGLFLHFAFDAGSIDGDTVKDLSGNGNDATMYSLLEIFGIAGMVIFMIVQVYRRREFRRQSWEGTIIGRAGGTIWILTPSDEVRFVKAALPTVKTVKIGDSITKHAGVLKTEVTPRDLAGLGNGTRQRIIEASEDVEPLVASAKSKIVRSLFTATVLGLLILGSYGTISVIEYRRHGELLLLLMMAVITPLFLGLMLWLILRIRKQ